MKKSLRAIYFCAVVGSGFGLITGCGSKESPTASAARPLDGKWSVRSIECAPTAGQPYGGQPYGQAEAGGVGFLHNQSSASLFSYELKIGANSTLTETETLPHNTDLGCKTMETVALVFNDNNEFSLKGSKEIKASPENGVHCGQVAATSLVHSYGLADVYSYTVSGDTLTAVSKTDNYCSSYGHAGVKSVLTLVRI